jgi:Tfp pilus assembly protein PilV
MMSRILRRGQADRGHTLNEVLVAMNIVVVGILGYAISTVGVIRGNASNSHYAAAVNLAQDKMEQLKGSEQLSDVNNCPLAGERDITETAEPGGTYNRCWIISDSSLGAQLKQIVVTVSWEEPAHQEITLTTLVFSG